MNQAQKKTRVCDTEKFLVLNEELIKAGNMVRFRVRGRSMYPFLQENDVVKVCAADLSRIKLGDIVFYRNSHGKPVVHRVVRREVGGNSKKSFLVAQGDNNLRSDAPVMEEQIIGKVVAIKRDNGGTVIVDTRVARITGILKTRLALFTRRTLSFSKAVYRETLKKFCFGRAS